MQTFLPYPDFAASAAVLDGYGWQRHPAVRMWRGYPEAVAAYGIAVVTEKAATVAR